MNDRERDWSTWMRLAETGDTVAYRKLLEALALFLRAVVARRAGAYGLGIADVEDVVQEALLAIHLKRGTWEPSQPVSPWAAAIARNKMIDALRRRGRRLEVPIEDFVDSLPAPAEETRLTAREASSLLSVLRGRQHDVVKAVSVEGVGIRAAAERYGMSEGAVRVALHRGLAALAIAYRSFRE